MKTTGINRLVSALGKTPYQQNQVGKNNAEAQKEVSKTASNNSDAVKVSLSNFKPKPTETETSERSKKVEDIKAKVQAGTYQINSEKLASSLVQELGF